MNEFDRAKREFREYYDANIATLRDAERSVRSQILSALADQPSFATPHVVSRIKAREECISKFQRKYLARLAQAGAPYEIKNYIGDLIGVRVICLYTPDIMEIARLLEEEFDVLNFTDKTREVEVTADTFRYKGLHLDMELSARRKSLPAYARYASVRFEVQVRTAIQDAWSTLDHAIKYKKQVPHELSRRINALAALFEIADREFLAIRDQIFDLATGASSGTDQRDPDGHQSTVFDLLPVLQKHFPRFRFDDRRLRGFVSELQLLDPPLTPADLEATLTSEKAALRKYARHQWFGYRSPLNPLTLARHAIYLHDPETFAEILSESQRAKFYEWREGEARQESDGAPMKSSTAADGQEPDWFPE
ncbi:MAG: (p)ppGpp synthetase [Betaproteobacteria bacterium]|nr:(p)ppGpp synthetase [Betaproteobacteria bacterium]